MAEATILHNVNLEELKSIIKSTVKSELSDAIDSLIQKEDSLLTREETYRFLKIDSTTLWYWTKEGKLKCYGIGNKRYYKKNEVLECLTLLKH